MIYLEKCNFAELNEKYTNMKKIILIFILCALFSNINAQNTGTQFANSGFEQWTSFTAQPQNWNSLGYMGYNLCEIAKSTEHVEGSYSLQLKPKQLSQMIASLLNVPQMTIPGFITNGQIDLMSLLSIASSLSDYENLEMNDYMSILQNLKNVLSNGLRINDLPENIEGYYKFSPVNSDDIFVIAAYTLGQVGDSNTVTGGGVFYANQQTEGFENFSISMNYLNSENVEELFLVAFVMNMNTEATEFGSVKLDNININYSPISSCSTITTDDNIFAYPIPITNHYFNINIKTNENIQIFDLMGRKVKEITNYYPNTPIYIENKGIYIVKIADKNLKVIVE